MIAQEFLTLFHNTSNKEYTTEDFILPSKNYLKLIEEIKSLLQDGVYHVTSRERGDNKSFNIKVGYGKDQIIFGIGVVSHENVMHVFTNDSLEAKQLNERGLELFLTGLINQILTKPNEKKVSLVKAKGKKAIHIHYGSFFEKEEGKEIFGKCGLPIAECEQQNELLILHVNNKLFGKKNAGVLIGKFGVEINVKFSRSHVNPHFDLLSLGEHLTSLDLDFNIKPNSEGVAITRNSLSPVPQGEVAVFSAGLNKASSRNREGVNETERIHSLRIANCDLLPSIPTYPIRLNTTQNNYLSNSCYVTAIQDGFYLNGKPKYYIETSFLKNEEALRLQEVLEYAGVKSKLVRFFARMENTEESAYQFKVKILPLEDGSNGGVFMGERNEICIQGNSSGNVKQIENYMSYLMHNPLIFKRICTNENQIRIPQSFIIIKAPENVMHF
jgi:hypothetical protein